MPWCLVRAVSFYESFKIYGDVMTWQPAETAPRDGTLFLAREEVDGEVVVTNFYQLFRDNYVDAGNGLFRKERVLVYEGFNCNTFTEWHPIPPKNEIISLGLADSLNIAKGCMDYMGGYRSDAELEIYHHGIQTVINCLTAALEKGLTDSQVAVCHAIGGDATY